MGNLFTPNFGQVPYLLAGRDAVVSELTFALDNVPGDPSQTSIIIGARGTGKTSLLRTMSNIADARGWISVNVACIDGMLEDIIQQATRNAAAFLEKRDKIKFKSISVASVFGIEWEYTDAAPLNWRSRISDVLEALSEHDLGLLITVDELDPTLDELIQLTSIYQLLAGEERKIALFMAGLPHQASAMLQNKSVSFLRRAAQYHLDCISDADVEAAFRSTAEASGKTVDDAALHEATQAIGGFPYMLQLVGYRAWQVSDKSSRIDDVAVADGASLAELDMRTRVLKATLDSLSDNDLDFLQAMQSLGDMPTVADITTALGKSAAHVSTYKRRLLEQGVIKTIGRNRVGFALPYLAQYLPEYIEDNCF